MPPRKGPSKASRIGDVIRRQFSAGVVPVFSDNLLHPIVYSTGLDSLDVALGVGGFPAGRMIIIHGGEGVGKTTLCLIAIAVIQSLGGIAVYADIERKLDLGWARKMGVNVEELILVYPESIEEGFEVFQKTARLVRAQDSDRRIPVIMVWDSLQSGLAKRTVDATYADASNDFPRESKAYSQGLAKFVPCLSQTGVVFLATSQIRIKMDGFGGGKEKVGVGQAPLFYASAIVQLRNARSKGSIKRGFVEAGVEAVIVKNQVSKPWRIARFDNVFGDGLDRGGSTFYAALAVGTATPIKAKRGEDEGASGWFEVLAGIDKPGAPADVVKVQGAGGMSKLAREDPESYALVREAVRARIGREAGEVLDESERAAAAAEVGLEEGETRGGEAQG